MEQTVTLIRGNIGGSGALFDDDERGGEFSRMQQHVADMTAEGWELITVTTKDNNTTAPTMLFWRRP
jgi:hypothetical protein